MSRGNYTLAGDEDLRLAVYDKPLPCCGCGIGWCSFLLGFVCPFMWYYAAFLYLFRYYDRDPRERGGLTCAAFAALVCTIVVGIVLAVIFI